MADITYSLETLTGKHGALLEVVEAVVSDGRLIIILTDEDVLQRRDAPLKGVVDISQDIRSALCFDSTASTSSTTPRR